jgi:hypothetical protein
MNIRKEYKKYREIGTQLTDKIVKTCLHKGITKDAAKLMGILRGNELLIESEEEGIAFMDFVLNDYQVGNKTLVQTFQAQVEKPELEEQTLLDAWAQAYTSLFKIKSISPSEHSLILDDLLNGNQNIKLLDFALSESAVPGMLIFVRLIPFQDGYITSGVIFAFVETKEAYLLKQYKYQAKKVKSNNEAIQRFVAFFNLNRTQGMAVGYQ